MDFIQSDELLVWRDDPGHYQKPNERAQLAAYRQGGATIGLLTVPWRLFLCSHYFLTPPSATLRGTDVLHWRLYFYDAVLQSVKEHYVDTTPTGHKASILKYFARYFVIHLCWYCALLTCVPGGI